MNNNTDNDRLTRFGAEFQIKCISCLLSEKTFLERIYDIVKDDYWENDAHKWIVNVIIKYFNQYKDLPTLQVFKIKVDEVESDTIKQSIVEQLKLIYQKISESDIKFIKEEFLEFCKNQTLKGAIIDSVDHLKTGEYDKIKSLVDNAMKAGMERNVGHDYNVDIDARMSVMSRNCVKTNWNVIDAAMDGGLAKGELGVVTACAGSGKCVGPNTEIEIQYHEFGIEIVGNSGNPYILWINPFEIYKIDDKELFGWQVENVFFEIEKYKKSVVVEK